MNLQHLPADPIKLFILLILKYKIRTWKKSERINCTSDGVNVLKA